MIRQAEQGDSRRIAEIYNHYIINTVVTFEEQSVTEADILDRIQEAESGRLPYLVAETGDDIVGFAYASRWNGRCAYKFSVEVTVYLSPDSTGQGHGRSLYEVLFAELKKRSFHVAIAGIALPNPASIALHESFDMHKVGYFPEVGFKFGQWIDVGYWQRTLDV